MGEVCVGAIRLGDSGPIHGHHDSACFVKLPRSNIMNLSLKGGRLGFSFPDPTFGDQKVRLEQDFYLLICPSFIQHLLNFPDVPGL